MKSDQKGYDCMLYVWLPNRVEASGCVMDGVCVHVLSRNSYLESFVKLLGVSHIEILG